MQYRSTDILVFMRQLTHAMVSLNQGFPTWGMRPTGGNFIFERTLRPIDQVWVQTCLNQGIGVLSFLAEAKLTF